jgi:hypothetical protein
MVISVQISRYPLRQAHLPPRLRRRRGASLTAPLPRLSTWCATCSAPLDFSLLWGR